MKRLKIFLIVFLIVGAGIVGYSKFLSKSKNNDFWQGYQSAKTNVYRNDVYNYRVLFPVGAKVSEAGRDSFQNIVGTDLTAEQAFDKYSGKICTKIEFKNNVIYFSAKPNGERGADYVFCSAYPTGVGVKTKILNYETKLKIADVDYQIQLTQLDALVVGEVMLNDGIFVTFSSQINEGEGLDNFFAYQSIAKILESYQRLQ